MAKKYKEVLPCRMCKERFEITPETRSRMYCPACLKKYADKD